MVTIAQLAPTLIAAGLSAAELKKELRPHNAPAAILDPAIPPKRYRQAYLLLAKHPEMTNEQIAAKVTTITSAIVATIRAEVEAVIAKLNTLDPIDENTNPDLEVKSANINASTNRFLHNKHGLTDGDKVVISGIVDTTGIENGAEYFVINATANNFQLSLTDGGSVVDVVGAGSCDYLIVTTA
jgi:hypothetical protein